MKKRKQFWVEFRMRAHTIDLNRFKDLIKKNKIRRKKIFLAVPFQQLSNSYQQELIYASGYRLMVKGL